MSTSDKDINPTANWFWWAFIVAIIILCLIIFLFAFLFARLGFRNISNTNPISTSSPNLMTSPIVSPSQTKTNILKNPTATKAGTNTPSLTITIEPTIFSSNIQYATISDEIFRVNMRKSPGYQNKNDAVDVIIEVPSGIQVEVLDGPEVADGINWWHVKWNNYEGWIGEKTGSGKTILIFDN